MLKTHKNAFLEAIKEFPLETSLFEAKEEVPISRKPDPLVLPSFFERILMFISPDIEARYFEKYSTMKESKELPSFRISLRNTPLYFAVIQQPHNFNSYQCKYTVFQPYYPLHFYPHLGPREKEKSLDDVLKIFRGWLEESVSQYLNEQQTPDWWLQMDAYKNFFKNDSEEQPEDLEFTEEEKDDVKRSAHRFKLLLAENFEQTPIQAEKNNSQIDYLANAPGRVNRVDWRALAFSTLMGILVNLSVDTEKGRLLFALFQQAFSSTMKLLN